MKKSAISIENNIIEYEKLIFLKKQLLIIARAITGVKLSGCGINLENDKIKINTTGKQ